MENGNLYVKTLKSYKIKEEGNLTFKKGQIIRILEIDEERCLYRGQFQGKKSLKEGWFPTLLAVETDFDLDGKKSRKSRRGTLDHISSESQMDLNLKITNRPTKQALIDHGIMQMKEKEKEKEKEKVLRPVKLDKKAKRQGIGAFLTNRSRSKKDEG